MPVPKGAASGVRAVFFEQRCVVYQAGDRTQGFGGGGHDAPRLFFAGEVGLERGGAPAGIGNRGNQLLGAGARAMIMGGYGPAATGKGLRDGAANAPGRAGNQSCSLVAIRHGGKMRHGD
jgi:hypothetical protein